MLQECPYYSQLAIVSTRRADKMRQSKSSPCHFDILDTFKIDFMEEDSMPVKMESQSRDIPVEESSPPGIDSNRPQIKDMYDAHEETSLVGTSTSERWDAEELYTLRSVLELQDMQNKLTSKSLRELTRSHEATLSSLRKEVAQAEASLVMVNNSHVKSISEHALKEAELLSNVEKEKKRMVEQRDNHLRELEATLDLISSMRKDATSQAEEHQAELGRLRELLDEERKASRLKTSRVLFQVFLGSLVLFACVMLFSVPSKGLRKVIARMKDKGPLLGESDIQYDL